MTANIPYQATKKLDGQNEIVLHSITAIPQYKHQSFEELRFEDYSASGKISVPPTKTGSSDFGFGVAPSQEKAKPNKIMTHLGEKRPNDRYVKENNAGNTVASNKEGSSPPDKKSAPAIPFGSGIAAPVFSSGGFTFGPPGATGGTTSPAPAGGGFTFGSAFGSSANNNKKSPRMSAFSTSSGVLSPSKHTGAASLDNFLPPKASKKKISRASLQSKTTDSLEGYEKYREFMDKLAESGVDDYVDLPMIAVMGDTSSGKSSLLSNISLVELPSSDTLTTRCPIRLQMSNAKARSACVKVVWKDKPEDGDADFPERMVGEENWNDITDIIAEAQAHIIEKSGKEVARDIVCVDMKGPHCENLTLIDLPGIVRSTGKGESSTLSEDIRVLMNDYLRNERCVILAVHPSNVDFHNSQILADAKKVDPLTRRTIPVLTKPDLIDDGAETNVKDLLLGLKTEFEMGFHMVKGRGQKDLNEDVGIEDGLTKEEAFFRNKEPWRNVEDKSKFGTKSLRVKLAGLQMKLIQSSFESIISEMKDTRDEAAIELKCLGDIPSTLMEKRALFRNVREDMREGLGAESLNGRISQLRSSDAKRPSAEFHLASKKFQEELNCSKLANISSIQVETMIIATVNGKELRDRVCFVDDKRDMIFVKKNVAKNYVDETWKLTKKPGSVFKSNHIVWLARTDGTFDQLKPIPRKLVRTDPQWISDLIEQNRPYNLPIFLNPDLFDAIVADQIENEWTTPTMKLLEITANLMETASKKFINDITMIKSLPSLTEYLIRKSTEVIESTKADTKIEIQKFILREQTPYTQNHYLFENLSQLRTQRLMDEVLSSVVTHCGSGNTDSADDITSAIQQIFERNQKRSIDDHMAEEMQNALDSYGKVAFKRFVDTVPMICVQIMQRFPKMINDILSDVTDSEIEELVNAPLSAITDMNALKKKVETLDKGIDTVKGMSKGGISV
ncbi:hypothetical protein ACHAXR_010826 [Thalassiosira sp. AJA248-18]